MFNNIFRVFLGFSSPIGLDMSSTFPLQNYRYLKDRLLIYYLL